MAQEDKKTEAISKLNNNLEKLLKNAGISSSVFKDVTESLSSLNTAGQLDAMSSMQKGKTVTALSTFVSWFNTLNTNIGAAVRVFDKYRRSETKKFLTSFEKSYKDLYTSLKNLGVENNEAAIKGIDKFLKSIENDYTNKLPKMRKSGASAVALADNLNELCTLLINLKEFFTSKK